MGCVVLLSVHSAGQPSQTDRYQRFDQLVAGITPETTSSFESLASRLSAPFSGPNEKSRAIFSWIAHNIRYDADAFFAGRLPDAGPEQTLKRRLAVCTGYAGLFEVLAKSAGIEAVTIGGYAKGFGFESGAALDSKPNHAWNAVRVDGVWKLVDCTWGAGYIGDDRRFHQRFTPYYFFTPAEEFVYAHLPSDARWQLLAHPLSREDYVRLIDLRPRFFELGLKVLSPLEGAVRVDGEISAQLSVPSGVLCVATVLRSDQTLDERQTFAQRQGTNYSVRAFFPDRASYVLRLFAGTREELGKFEWILDYRVESTRGSGDGRVFPSTFTQFMDHEARLIEPMEGVLALGTRQQFAIRVPRAEKVAVIAGKNWTFLTVRDDGFEGTAEVGSSRLGVYARFPGRDAYEQLLEYQAQ